MTILKNSSNCSSEFGGIPSYYTFNEFFFFLRVAKKRTRQIATGISPKLDFVLGFDNNASLFTYLAYKFNQNKQKNNQINNKFVYKSCLSIR